MKNVLVFVAVIAIAVGASLYLNRSQAAHTQPSKLLIGFSLNEIIKRIPDAGLKQPVDGAGGGSGGVGSSAAISVYRRETTFTCQIQDSSFSEVSFMKKLKAEVEKEVTNNGAEIEGGGEFDWNFDVEYSLGHINGMIDVVGMRGEGNTFKLICVMREFSWKK